MVRSRALRGVSNHEGLERSDSDSSEPENASTCCASFDDAGRLLAEPTIDHAAQHAADQRGTAITVVE
jgi:hypothetical protein